MAVRRSDQRGFDVEKVLEECLEEYDVDPAKTNVVSAISTAFVNCYARARTRRYATLFSRVVSEHLYRGFRCQSVSELLAEVSRRLDAIAGSISTRYHLFDVRLTTISRLLVHVSNPLLPLEISLAWDPVLNVPFIPSSSLKGAARAYFETNGVVVDGITPTDIFGSNASEGVVFFTDAYPVSCRGWSLIEPDVIAPHYSEAKYSIDEASASPVPLVFPAVAPRVSFRFLIAMNREKVAPQVSIKIMNEISKALSLGLGAKTSVGFGRLRVEHAKRAAENRDLPQK